MVLNQLARERTNLSIFVDIKLNSAEKHLESEKKNLTKRSLKKRMESNG